MSFINMLSWWQWAILAAVPPAIVLLYFLKLKRQPLEVPSTYLWHKSVEDLRVNSIWQRLRQSLLLLLQLLLVALAMIALVRPGWEGATTSGDRYIFLVDNSASMSAVDVQPSRLHEAKRLVGELIDQMASGDVAMIISFSDIAHVEQPFTDNRRDLRRRLEGIAQTNRSTSLGEALRVAAGLANPGREFEIRNNEVAEGLPATMYLFSDGRFPDIEGFSLGHLKPVFVPIGQADAENVGITDFSTRRSEGNLERLQAFARLENCGDAAVKAEVELSLDGSLVDADTVDLKPHGSGAVVFNLSDVHSGALLLRVRSGGALKADDQAWAAVNPPRRSKVLLVTPGDEALQLALGTDRALELADVAVAKPQLLETKEYRQQAAASTYDLIIYDQCQPREMPQANTMFIGRLPPGQAATPTVALQAEANTTSVAGLPPSGWSALDKFVGPQVIDVNSGHPIMQLIDLGNVRFAEARPLKPPTGSTPLIETDAGILFALAPRERFEDAVLGAEIVGINEKGEKYANTDWPLRLSFPVFILNVLDYFGGNRGMATASSVAPGRPVSLSNTGTAEGLSVTTPLGNTLKIKRGTSNIVNFTGTDELGIYEVREGKQVTQRFAVNLFDSFETDIRPRPEIRINYVDVKGQSHWKGARRETWKALLLAALGVLLLEWYIYNRRVYV